MEEPDGHHKVERRHGDGTRTSPACRPGWTRWKPGRPSGGRRSIRNMADARRRTINTVYKDPRTGFGSIAQPAGSGARPQHLQRGGEGVLDGLRVNQDRPCLKPRNQLQVHLADMKAFGGKPYPFMLVAIDTLWPRSR